MRNNSLKKLLKKICGFMSYVIYILFRFVPIIKIHFETKQTQTPVRFTVWFLQKVIGLNRSAYWPVHFTSLVTSAKKIIIGIETSPGLMPGCYIQGSGGIRIGDYTQIASNVGLISSNHDLYDSRIYSGKSGIEIGRYCWIGMGSIILPGVSLGDFTIVGAGSIVTKSYPDGYCVIGGNPAKKIKSLDKDKCIFHKSKYPYNGYISSDRFEEFSHTLNLAKAK
jgi:acetyltransferase-like isoleucine patch superfamily enzyme